MRPSPKDWVVWPPASTNLRRAASHEGEIVGFDLIQFRLNVLNKGVEFRQASSTGRSACPRVCRRFNIRAHDAFQNSRSQQLGRSVPYAAGIASTDMHFVWLRGRAGAQEEGA